MSTDTPQRTACHPLSYGQQRLWFMDRLSPDSTEYLELSAFRLRGPLNEHAMGAALAELVARHEILRTTYTADGDQPMQRVHSATELPMRVVDISGDPAADRENRLNTLLDIEATTPIDIGVGPVLRATLIRLAEGDHVFAIAIHHIAFDGWSEAVLFDELWQRYEAHLASAPMPAAPADVQYRHHVDAQRAALKAGALDDQFDYWRQRLADSAPLELYPSRPRSAVRGSSGGLHTFQVPAALAHRLRQMARTQRATPFTVLLAAFKVLLARYTGSRDLVVGTAVAGRTESAFEEVAGFFTNMLPLRTELPADPSFTEVLARTRDTCVDAFVNQDVPFDQLVDALNIARDLSRTPVFQIVFVLQNTPQPQAPHGLIVERVPPRRRAARYDLNLELTEAQDGSLTAYLTYATALFGVETVSQLAENYLRLLAAVVDDPDAPMSRLSLLSDAERELIESQWVAGPDVTEAVEPIHLTVMRHAAQTPHAVAVSHGDRALTYAELDTQSNRFAHHLTNQGVTVETLVGICLSRGLDEVVAMLGVLKAGGAFVPLDATHPDDRLAGILDDARVSVLVTELDQIDRFSPQIVCVLMDNDADRAQIAAAPEHPPRVAWAPENLAYVIYTSGSTGRPKGVAVAHAGLHGVAVHQRELLGVNSDDRILRFASPSFDASIYETVLALAHGGTLCLADADQARPGVALSRCLAEQRITAALVPPSCLAATPAVDLPHLRVLTVGGEACPESVVDDWAAGRRLVNLYGPTESTILATAGDCVGGEGRPSIGRPIHGMRVHLLDENLTPVPLGMPGEVYIGGHGIARGYLYRASHTAERFLPDPFGTRAGDRLYRTGDQARYLPDGRIEYLGRGDHQVKIRGFRVELGEVEGVIGGNPLVDRAVVLPHTDSTGDQQLVGYVVPSSGSALDPAQLRAYLRRKVPEYLVPAHLFVVDTIPLTTSGKVDHRALPVPGSSPASSSDDRQVPRTTLEKELLGIWSAVLGLGEIAVDDSFFDIGGDSIRAVRLVGLMRERRHDVMVQDLFSHKSIAELAGVLEGRAPLVSPHCAIEPFSLLDPSTRAMLPGGLTDAYPVARLQLGMLYEMLRDRSDHSYHDVTCFYIRDDRPFTLPAFREAARAVAARHDVLRTSFDLTTYSEPIQLVHEGAEIPIVVHDLSGHSAARQEELVAHFISDQRHRPFDIGQAPLLSLHVHVLGPAAWRLSMIQCHAILDGWSEHLVLRELLDGYRAAAADTEHEYEPLALRFADFIPLEHAAVQAEETRRFWIERTRDAEPFDLPDAWRGQPADGDLFYTVSVPVADLLPRLRSVASVVGVSMKVLLHTAFLRTLGAVTGQTRFSTGLVCNGRPEERDGDRIAGLFLNTVPFVAALSGPTWREQLLDVFAEHQALEPHRRFPLADVQNHRVGHQRLVDVLFNYVDFHIVDRDVVDFDRTLDLGQSEIGLDVTAAGDQLMVNGRRDRVDRRYGELLGRILRRVLESVAADPDGDAHGSFWPPDDLAELVETGSGSRVDRPELPLHDLIAQRVASAPSQIAVEDGERRLTYAELDTRANQVAWLLRQRGVTNDEVVGVSMRRGADLIAVLLGVLKAGAAYLPLDPRLPREQLRLILDDVGMPVVVTDQVTAADLLGDLPAELIVVDSEPAAGGTPAGGNSSPRPEVGPDHGAYVLYTSGSTGRPNGVLTTHRGLLNRLLDTVERHDITPQDRVIQRSGIGFDAVCWEVFVPLLASATIVIASSDAEFDSATLVETVKASRATVLHAVPTLLEALASNPAWRECTSLRLIYSGGEQLSVELSLRVLEGLSAKLVNAYGPTECSIGITEGQWRDDLVGSAVPIGGPLANVDLMILGRDGQPVPDGASGELFVSGPALARGYIERRRLTAERFVPDPFHGSGARMYRTGDVVCRHGGELMFLGRVDRQVKISGVRIEPESVERALTQHPAVSAAAVTVDRSGGRARLVAYVSTRTPVTTTDLRRHLRGRVPEQHVPAAIVVVETLPVTYSGKVDQDALPPASAGGEARGPRPRTAAEHLVAKVWAELLDVAEIGVDDDFFQLGGHSLLIPQLASRLQFESGVAVPLREFFAAFTVAAQARLIATHRIDAPGPRPGPRGARRPLSFGQQRLWFLDHLEPGNPEYLVPLAVHVPSTADLNAVRAALQEVSQRHDVLRTRYVADDGEPFQVVDTAAVVDLRSVREIDTGLVALIRDETGRGVDLENGPVWRATLIERPDGDAVLLLVVHHIACDGWSAGILHRELTELLSGRRESLPPLPVQYADFATWQRDRLTDELLDDHLGYWRQALAGLSPLDLPTDRPRPAQWRPDGRIARFTVAAEPAQRLLRIGREHGATPFMALLAVFYTVLHRHTGGADLAVGTPVAGRVRSEVDDVVGFFVNTLVLRTDLGGDPRFTDLLQRVRACALAAFAHQELPFERLVDDLQPERDPSRSPLVQVMFEMSDGDMAPTPSEQDVDTAVLDSWTAAKFDLTLSVGQATDGSLDLALEYATALFDPSTIARLADHFALLVESFGAEPGASVTEPELIGEADLRLQLTEWNATAAEMPVDCLHHLVAVQAARTPNAVAVEFGSERLTYDQLDGRANHLAWQLRNRAVQLETPVGVQLERSAGLVIALLAVLKAGGCFVPVEPDYPPARVERVLAAAGARLCLVDSDRRAEERESGTPVSVDYLRLTSELCEPVASAGPPCTAGPDNAVAVYFTSGSTGEPKGVVCTHRGWVNRLVAMQDRLDLAPGEAVLQKTTLVFDDAPVEIFWPLLVGGRVAILAPDAHRDPHAILDAAIAHRAAVALFVPSMLRLIVDALDPVRRPALRALRHVGTSGEALDPELVAQFLDRFGPDGPSLHNHWGVTEVSIDSTQHTCGLEDAVGSGAVTIGRPIVNNQVYVLDDNLRPVPVGMRGQLYVGGIGVARGYVGEPGRTASAFVPHPYRCGERLYRTGDRAMLRADGSIVFLGRLDRQLKIRGVRVEPGEVEHAMRTHPAVRDAATTVWTTPGGDQQLAGYFVPTEQDDPTASRLAEHLHAELPSYMVPAVLIAVPRLPRTPSGKVDHRALPAPDIEMAVAQQGRIEPRTVTEERLVYIWGELLGVEAGVQNNFFEVGGHSLMAARLIARIGEEFDLELPLRTIFDRPTIAALAEVVEAQVRDLVTRMTDAELQAEYSEREESAV